MPKIVDPAPMLRAENVRNCRVVEHREALLERLPRGARVAEVGVLAGDFSEKILAITRPSHLLLIDSFDSKDWAWTRRFRAAQHEAFVRERFAEEIRRGQVTLRKGLSWDRLAECPDHSLDWIYIDAGHDYGSVTRDLEAARAKVAPGGLLVMNDYTMYDPNHGSCYGVVHATNEFCLKHGWELIWLALQEHLFNDVALRKIP